MTILKLLYYPDKRLRKIANTVHNIDNKVHSIIEDMFETMYNKNGIGLAATQINIHKRIIVIDVSESCNQRFVFINPVLLEKNGKTSISEGCLSIPNTRGVVQRSKNIKVRALNQKNQYFEVEASELLAICIQHEMDHLVGRLFIDYLKKE